MKIMTILCVMGMSLSALALAVYSEEDVQAALGADKVIAVSMETARALAADSEVCMNDLWSKSAKAFVVKAGERTVLYVTNEQIADLKACVKL